MDNNRIVTEIEKINNNEVRLLTKFYFENDEYMEFPTELPMEIFIRLLSAYIVSVKNTGISLGYFCYDLINTGLCMAKIEVDEKNGLIDKSECSNRKSIITKLKSKIWRTMELCYKNGHDIEKSDTLNAIDKLVSLEVETLDYPIEPSLTKNLGISWYNLGKRISLKDATKILPDNISENILDIIGKNDRYLSQSLRFDVLKRDNYRCKLCGRTAKEDGVKLEIDHRIPRAKGGQDTIDNLWTLCFDCNRGKRDKDL